MHTAPRPWQMRRCIEQYLCESDHFKPEHHQLDTTQLLDRFNQLVAGDARGVLVLASRPFSNLNNLFSARPERQLEVIDSKLEFCSCGNPQACWWVTRTRYVMDQLKLAEVKDTYNGPALLSNLLPPIDHLAGRFGHPSLQSGKQEAWKQVAGKLEATSDALPALFFTEPNAKANLSKKELRQEALLQDEKQAFFERFVYSTLAILEKPKGYPGGAAELHKRCFSLYLVKFERPSFSVEWLGDYTHKKGAWSPKSSSVTVPLEPYRVALHNGASLAAWNAQALLTEQATH